MQSQNTKIPRVKNPKRNKLFVLSQLTTFLLARIATSLIKWNITHAMKILNVAEKPDAAKKIAAILSRGQFRSVCVFMFSKYFVVEKRIFKVQSDLRIYYKTT